MFPMKTTVKTIFSLMAAGFVLTTITARSSAQSSAPSPEKPLSPQIMKILCERSPLNSRCAQGSNPEGAGSMSGDTASKKDKGEMKGDKKGDKKEEMTPSTPSTAPAPTGIAPDPSVPAPATGSPAGGGTLPPTGAPGTAPDPSVPAPATIPAPVESPGTMPKP
jgi:hypothetical protein